jgi:8-oxo-dGTP pyrophosphatase MutT (NUDIX family)
MQTLGSREVYVNSWMSVREDAVLRADGSQGIYGVIDKPDYALVIPLDGDRLQLVEQYRYALGIRRWEFPQGTAPEREALEPAELARRELREETGLVPARLQYVGLLDVAPGQSSQRGRVFLATDLTDGPHQREPEEQDMRTGWFSRAEFERMVGDGEITDAQSIAAYALLLLHERRNGS